MNLFDILACPNCKIPVSRQKEALFCSECVTSFPIVNGIPVMFPDGSIPEITHEADLHIRETYDPWYHRTILQSLLDNQIVLEIGAGNMALNDPCIIRMDVTLSPYVDLVADAHYLPFLPESLDYIFSLAVFEHLKNPFQASQSIYDALKDGGYIHHDCCFIFPYHGYPNHFFNATLQGLEQIFQNFVPLKKGVAPYQMPSFGLGPILNTYLQHSRAADFEHGRQLTTLIKNILDLNLTEYDIYFSEKAALNVAGGVYFIGMKKATSESSLIPLTIKELWNNQEELKNNFPNPEDLTTVNNILIWAKNEGKSIFGAIDIFFNEMERFNKHLPDDATIWDRSTIRSLPLLEAKFCAIGFDPNEPLEVIANRLSE